MAKAAKRPVLQRDTIVAAARELIVSGGLGALSLRRLASRMGVTAPALYAHVRDKQDLLREVADREIEWLAARFEELDDPDPIARIRAHGRAYVSYARDNPQLFRLMLQVPPADLNEQSPVPAGNKAFALAAHAVDEAIAAGLLVADDSVLVAFTLWCGAHGAATLLQLGFDLQPELEDTMVAEITNRILSGYGAKPPLPRPPAS